MVEHPQVTASPGDLSSVFFHCIKIAFLEAKLYMMSSFLQMKDFNLMC